MFGPTIKDVGELLRATDSTYTVKLKYNPPGLTCEDVGCKCGTPAPQDDPQTPTPSPLAGAWQCPGCGTIYNYTVNSCACQRRNMVSDGNTTGGVATYPAYGTFTTEMP